MTVPRLTISPVQKNAYNNLLLVAERQLINIRKLKPSTDREQQLLHENIIGSLQSAVEECRLCE